MAESRISAAYASCKGLWRGEWDQKNANQLCGGGLLLLLAATLERVSLGQFGLEAEQRGDGGVHLVLGRRLVL
eukprot:6200772-Pleurochrysis_carterae.AAC.3